MSLRDRFRARRAPREDSTRPPADPPTVSITRAEQMMLLHALAYREAHWMVERQQQDPSSPMGDIPANLTGDMLAHLLRDDENTWPGQDLILTTLFTMRELQDEAALPKTSLPSLLRGWRVTMRDGDRELIDDQLALDLSDHIRYLRPDDLDDILNY